MGFDGIANDPVLGQYMLHAPERRQRHAARAIDLHLHRFQIVPDARDGRKFLQSLRGMPRRPRETRSCSAGRQRNAGGPGFHRAIRCPLPLRWLRHARRLRPRVPGGSPPPPESARQECGRQRFPIAERHRRGRLRPRRINASRTGVRLTPKRSVRTFSLRRCPGDHFHGHDRRMQFAVNCRGCGHAPDGAPRGPGIAARGRFGNSEACTSVTPQPLNFSLPGSRAVIAALHFLMSDH